MRVGTSPANYPEDKECGVAKQTGFEDWTVFGMLFLPIVGVPEKVEGIAQQG